MNKFLINIILLILILVIISNIKYEKSKILTNPDNITIINIEKINKKNQKIKNIEADLVIKQGFFSLNGFIIYEKQELFMMSASSFFRKELEVGSNENYFWFWTKNEDILYFCKHEDVEKTRLKVIFYPKVIKTFLGIDEFFDFQIFENKVIQKLPNNLIKVSTLKDNILVRHELYHNDNLILTCEIIEFYEDLPKKIKINWLEENINQEWILKNIKVNKSNCKYEMPNYKNRINLKDY